VGRWARVGCNRRLVAAAVQGWHSLARLWLAWQRGVLRERNRKRKTSAGAVWGVARELLCVQNRRWGALSVLMARRRESP
jgi:hypothetical protein